MWFKACSPYVGLERAIQVWNLLTASLIHHPQFSSVSVLIRVLNQYIGITTSAPDVITITVVVVVAVIADHSFIVVVTQTVTTAVVTLALHVGEADTAVVLIKVIAFKYVVFP
jgi:hypothetical protein